MFDIIFLLNSLLTGQNTLPFISLIFTFIATTIIGSWLFVATIKKYPNKLIVIGAGAITGTIYFIGILSVLSYFLKGKNSIKAIFFSSLALCLIFIYKNRSNLKSLHSKVTYKKIIVAIIVFLYSALLYLFAGNTVIGGDTLTQWSFATSFQRGNYPVVLPWQPESLTIYHQGTYIFLGMINAITNVEINQIHYYFSSFILIAILFLSTGIAYEKSKNILCLLPFIFGILVFGPIFLIGNFSEFFNSINLNTGNFNFVQKLIGMPSYENIKGAIGSGALSIGGLVYINFIAHSIGVLLTFIYLIIEIPNNKIVFKYLVLGFIFCTLLSINEAVAIVISPIIIWDIIIRFINTPNRTLIYKYIFIFIISLSMFFVIQNPIRDSLLSPAKGEQRFKILSATDKSMFYDDTEYNIRIQFIDSKFLNTTGKWYIPNMFLFVILVVILSLYSGSKYTIFLGITGLLSLIFGMTIINTFWTQNALRFVNQGIQISMFTLGFSLLIILKKNSRLALWTGILVLFLFSPQLMINNVKLLYGSMKGSYPFYKGNLINEYPLYTWIYKNTKFNDKFLLVDEFPVKEPSSMITLHGLSHHGLFIPTVQPEPKVLNADLSSQWFDAMRYLSPYALDILNIDYVYIKTGEENRYTLDVQQKLSSERYFKRVYNNEAGTLYKIQEEYKSTETYNKDTQWYINQVPYGTTVYVDSFRFQEIRKGLLLSLQEKANIYGPPALIGQDYFLFIEKKLKLDSNLTQENKDKINYWLIDSRSQTTDEFSLKHQLIDKGEYISLWKKI